MTETLTESNKPTRAYKLTSLVSTLALALSISVWGADITQLSVSSVTASGNDGNVPVNTLDGSLATRWSAQGDGQWILYDIGSSKTITSLSIAWHKGDQRTAFFDIQTSADTTSWQTVFSGPSSGSSFNFEPCDVTDSVGRYVRIVGHGNSSSPWNSIAEVIIYGISDASGLPPLGETLLPVLSMLASSSDAGNVPLNTLDKNLATRWSALGDGQWILYDLGFSKTVSSVDIAWYKGNRRSTRFDILTSENATSWTTVFTGVSSGQTLNPETYDVNDSAARYVRVVGHGTPVSAWNSITEVEIYGVSPSTPSVVVNVPSDVLNLTNWKLTLPIDTAHAGTPDEISQPELDIFADPAYFHLNGTQDGVVFKAHCGGVATSGSGYPRSELREMINRGRDKASWSTSLGTHIMEITQAITHVPDVKRHVVAGQIHDASDDVIVFRLEAAKLFIDENGNNGPVLNPNYQLGDVFTVKFVARNGGVECYYNGQYVYTYGVQTSGCYFKAGAYTQSNTSKGDAPTAYGEVTIYALSVRHE